MKKTILFKSLVIAIISLTIQNNTFSQGVVISESAGATPDGNAILDTQSTTQGLLIPRLTNAQRTILTGNSPAEGLLIYDTDDQAFYLRGNGTWVDLSSSAEIWSQDASTVFLSNNTKNVGIGTDPSTSKFVVQANTGALADDVLFEVKDETGKPIFRVTSEGVRVYIKEKTKGISGGFAVGHYGSLKTAGDEFFTVTPYDTKVNTLPPKKGAKANSGGFAVGRYASLKGGGIKTNFYTNPDETRIYTDSPSKEKAVSGGFAVGRYGSLKNAEDSLYFFTAHDSTRVYINETVGNAEGGFTVGTYSDTKAGNVDYFNINASNIPEIINPSEARILWYPLKEAFLSGRVLVESIDSVGLNSWASGFESKSIGSYSQALGYQARAFGNNSTAIGYLANVNANNSYAFGNNTYVNSINSYAMGNGAKVIGEGAYAIGSGAEASGDFSFAIGSDGVDGGGSATNPTQATGNYSYAFGMGSLADNKGAFVIGTKGLSSGQYSTSMGYNTTASGNYSTAMGYRTNATGYYSTAMGNNTTASGSSSMVMGYSSSVTGNYSYSLGYNADVTGDYSVAIGRGINVTSDYSVAIGYNASASGFSSVSLGIGTEANATQSVALGGGNIANAYASTAMGSGNVANGYRSTATGFRTVANGYNSFSMGYETNSKSYAEFVIGRYNDTIISTNIDTWIDTDPVFVIGNGYWSTGNHNAMVVFKNGRTNLYPVNSSRGLYINHDKDQSGATYGIQIDLDNNYTGSSTNYGIYSSATNNNGAYSTYGVRGWANGTSTGGKYGVYGYASGSGTRYGVYCSGNMAYTGTITDVSDIKFKENVTGLNNVLPNLMKIDIKTFTYKRTKEFENMGFPEGLQYGVIAQELENVFPDLVVNGVHPGSESVDGDQKSNEINYKGVKYVELVPIAIKAIQEQQEIIDNQDNEIEQIKSENEILKARLDKIEKLLMK